MKKKMPKTKKWTHLKEINDSNLSRGEKRKEILTNKTVLKKIGGNRKVNLLAWLKLGRKDEVLPASKASESNVEIAFTDTTYFQMEDGKKALEVMYRNCWGLNRAINIRQNLKIFRGFKINFEDMKEPEKAKDVIDEFLKGMHPTRPMLSLLLKLKNIGINTDIFGSGYWNKIFTPTGTLEKPLPVSRAKDFIGITPIHPIHFDFKRNASSEIVFKNGVPEAYAFTKDSQTHEVEIERVAHLIYNFIGDEVLGVSLIEPIFKTCERLMKIEEGVCQSILTHMPAYDVIVGDESRPATQEMMDQAEETMVDLNAASEFIHPHWIRISQIEAFSLTKAASDYMKPFITAIASHTGVPEFLLLGRGEGTNKATASVMKEFIYQTIIPLQLADSMFIEEQIFAPLMKLNNIEGIPLIEWNDITPQDALEAAKSVDILSKIMIDNKSLIGFEEGRELAGLGKPSYKLKKEEKKEVKIDGVRLAELHGGMIRESKKTHIVKSKSHLNMIEKNLYLIYGNKAHGILRLNRPIKINLDEFKRYRAMHRITEAERNKWWAGKKELFLFKFNLLKKFDQPLDVKTPSGTYTFVNHDSIKFGKNSG